MTPVKRRRQPTAATETTQRRAVATSYHGDGNGAEVGNRAEGATVPGPRSEGATMPGLGFFLKKQKLFPVCFHASR
jgi:hypothetical protein